MRGLCFGLALMIAQGLAAPAAAADDPPGPLRPADPVLLARLDRVASLYLDTALRFTCEEKIIYAQMGRPSQFYNFEYIYAFSKDIGLDDYRVDVRSPRKGGKLPDRARLGGYGLPYYLTRGYSWVFLLDRLHQPRFRYAVGPETHALARPALPITFEPIEPIDEDVNDWYGTIWVDAETLQPLRVEAMKAPERRKEQAFLAALASTGPIKGPDSDGWIYARVMTEFTHEKNAMRFPGKIVATGKFSRIRVKRGQRVAEERPLVTVTQLYVNYQFFGVSAEETIRRIVRED